MKSARQLVELSEAERTAAMKHYEILRPQIEDGVPLSHVAWSNHYFEGQRYALEKTYLQGNRPFTTGFGTRSMIDWLCY